MVYYETMFIQYENKAMTKYQKKILINTPLKDHKVGDIVTIDTDKDGTPLSRYWRDRVKDAQIDNCIEFIQEKSRSKK